MKSKSTLLLIASIIFVFVGFLGVVLGVSSGEIPAWSTAFLIFGGITFLLWIVSLTMESVSKAKEIQKEQRTQRIQQRNQIAREHNALFHELCSRATEILQEANRPSECNKISFLELPFLFPDLKSYQYFAKWDIWRTDDLLYFYNEHVENYPENCTVGEAPLIASIMIKDIQYFAMEGSISSETIVSGGVVKQDQKTGKVSQTALKTKTVERDKREVKLSVLKNGIVKKLILTKESYDVLLALIPEKEKSVNS